MLLRKILGSLLLASAISFSIGAILLYTYTDIPIILIELTAAAVAILIPLAYFVLRGKEYAGNQCRNSTWICGTSCLFVNSCTYKCSTRIRSELVVLCFGLITGFRILRFSIDIHRVTISV
jgi:hypothetical protein